MNYEEFTTSTASDEPASELPLYLKALWHEKRGDWDTAHKIVQDIENPEAAAIHAYLHRREGDVSNAQYWYRRAGRRASLELPLDKEWENLAREFLS